MNLPKEFTEGERGSTKLERSFATVVQVITVTAIIGGTALMFEMKTTVAVILERVSNMQVRLDDFRSFSVDRYTATEAEKEISPIVTRQKDFEERLRKLERNGG